MGVFGTIPFWVIHVPGSFSLKKYCKQQQKTTHSFIFVFLISKDLNVECKRNQAANTNADALKVDPICPTTTSHTELNIIPDASTTAQKTSDDAKSADVPLQAEIPTAIWPVATAYMVAYNF